MLRLTLAQMRRSVGRLAAGGIAIAIGTAFVAATLISGAVITRTSYDAITATLARADLVAERLGTGHFDEIEALPGVVAVDPVVYLGTELVHGRARLWAVAMPVASVPSLEAQTLGEGVMPTRPGEIALPRAMAERLKTAVGQDIVTPVTTFAPVTSAPDTDETEGVTTDETLRVVGLLDDPHGAYTQQGGVALISRAEALAWSGSPSLAEASSGDALIALAPGADRRTVQAQIAALGDQITVVTKDEAAQRQMEELGDGTNGLTTVVLGFAGIALVVAALVISNTFQVLVAQRTRTLALLRCVGAAKRQLRSSVMIEAAILGLASSAVGVISGIVLAQVALLALRAFDLGVVLPGTVPLTVPAVLVPIGVGTLVTVLAALMPARAATRVAPIAALRPADAPLVTARSSRVRLVLSVLLTVGGAALLLFAAMTPEKSDALVGLAVGMLGGTASFVGILLGAVFWVPRVVSGVGALLGRTGASARLAAANTGRNPRRTAATSTALLIGVTLVAMMSTGAASAKVSLGNELDDRFPVDVSVEMPQDADGAQPVTGIQTAVSELDEVAVAVPVSMGSVLVGAPGSPDASDGRWASVIGVDPQGARDVMRTAAAASVLADDVVVMRESAAARLFVQDGDVVPVQLTTDGEAAAGSAVAMLRVVVRDFGGQSVLVTTRTYDLLSPAGVTNGLWARLADVSHAGAGFAKVQDALSDTPASIEGAGALRAQFQQVVDVLLAIVVALLGVAVVIALVGVANTLSLSVLERRRESATLRAIGLSRRQLRLTLAIEGIIIAGVGAVVGSLLGLVYGWAGAATVLGSLGDVTLLVPWRDLGLVLVVAVVAGLLASILPARSAANTSPVEALAVD